MVKYGIIHQYKDEAGESQPDPRSAEGCDSRVESKYECFDCISGMHNVAVKVQRTTYVNRNFSRNQGLVLLVDGRFGSFCSVHAFHTSMKAPMQTQHLSNKTRHQR